MKTNLITKQKTDRETDWKTEEQKYKQMFPWEWHWNFKRKIRGDLPLDEE